MRSFCHVLALAVPILLASGCARLSPDGPDTGHGDVWDAVFNRRHTDPKAHVREDPMLALAREITVLEDDIRRDGSVTVKAPDVWGDADLMHYIQEYDGLLADSVKTFDETLQAYIARSDQMELQSATGLGMAVGGGAPPVAVPATVNIDNKGAMSSSGTLTPTPQDIQNLLPSELIAKAVAAAEPSAKKVGVEPTELERQRSTFILVNQALRRRNTGDDGSRAAGYALYKFRIPVSVLPGRETYQGYSAVVTLRAQLHVDGAHLRYTFPKLVIADLVETLTPVILDDWDSKLPPEERTVLMGQLREAVDCLNNATRKIHEAGEPLHVPDVNGALDSADESLKELRDRAAEVLGNLKKLSSQHAALPDEKGQPAITDIDAAIQEGIFAASTIEQIVDELEGLKGAKRGAGEYPVIGFSPKSVFTTESIYYLRDAAKARFNRAKPKTSELRNYLFKYLAQVHSVMQARRLYYSEEENGGYLVWAVGEKVERGEDLKAMQDRWLLKARQGLDMTNAQIKNFVYTSWLVAVQSGILNQNLHRILKELHLRGRLSDDPNSFAGVLFFLPDESGEAARLWDILVNETFPLHVFALDPQIEEQNVYDAFSRRREMQLALAISVASGRFNTGQKVALSRQLALDEATIAMNRTAVGFSHGNDTFGWYFYPRVQTPPTESSNIGALARMIWSTGPTERYDLKHRKLEPGMRECEVLVAMPSFVTEVSFDVTTNWESLAQPGVTKRSYEEMVAQGGRLHRLRVCLQDVRNQHCYRPGDYARLLSRMDQLEQMLSMQTYLVSVPYEYEQTGTDLFDTGKAHLRPVLHGYYGLEFVQADDGTAAHFFLTGKNFHPTLTHVIVGGTESHSLVKEDCEVISRDLLRVKVTNVRSKLSRTGQFEMRVGTPAGLSEPLTVTAAPDAPPSVSDFDWKATPAFRAKLVPRGEKKERTWVCLDPGTFTPRGDQLINNQTPSHLPTPGNGQLILDLSVKFKSGIVRNLRVPPKKANELGTVDATRNPDGSLSVKAADLRGFINRVIKETMDIHDLDIEKEGVIVGTTYLKFDDWPYIKLDKQVTVEFWSASPKDKDAKDPARA